MTRVSGAMKLPLGRLGAAAAGIVMIGVGLRGIVNHGADTHPRSWVIWIVAAALGDDLIVIPVLLLIGAIVVRVVPAAVRSVVQTALVVTGAVGALGIVAILASNRRIHRDNPSLLPLPYVRNLMLILIAIWVIAAICMAVLLVRRRHGVQIPTS
jgi:hypothetical protein